MLAGDHDVLGTRSLEDAGPFRGIPHLGSEHWRKIAIFKIFSVVLGVKLCDFSTVGVGVQPMLVPLAVGAGVTKTRHRIDAPVNKDSELRIFEPLGSLMRLKRLPIWFIVDGWFGGAGGCGDQEPEKDSMNHGVSPERWGRGRSTPAL